LCSQVWARLLHQLCHHCLGSVSLSRHKQWIFAISGFLIALSFLNMYYTVPRLKANACTPDNPSACADASKFSKILLWFSAFIYAVGFFTAYALGPDSDQA
jgi:hypothetical protein